jgi:hypothetical protein
MRIKKDSQMNRLFHTIKKNKYMLSFSTTLLLNKFENHSFLLALSI